MSVSTVHIQPIYLCMVAEKLATGHKKTLLLKGQKYMSDTLVSARHNHPQKPTEKLQFHILRIPDITAGVGQQRGEKSGEQFWQAPITHGGVVSVVLKQDAEHTHHSITCRLRQPTTSYKLRFHVPLNTIGPFGDILTSQSPGMESKVKLLLQFNHRAGLQPS